MTPALGLIEGYYGTPWSREARASAIAALAPSGYRFYIYAPKADEFLRRRWQEPHDEETFEALASLSRHCQRLSVRFGAGLSPYELYRDFNSRAKAALAAKLDQLAALRLDILALLFDDMRGDLPELAARQIEIAHFVAGHLPNVQLIVCPTYYSDDPLLDRIFGARPADYLETLGRDLSPAIALFWTGPEVCARELTPGHLARIGATLRRKPVLWDNYPVNDGPRMSRTLHLRAFTGRPAAIAAHVDGHAVNPALQPTLSLIPSLTLAASYAQGEAYDYGAAWRIAAGQVCGEALAAALAADIVMLQDSGLGRLEPATVEKLRHRYGRFDHPAAREVKAFLDGRYRFTGEMR